jgi:hypothetical protein
MPLSRLELISSHADETLPRIRFVVHGTVNATDAISISEFGLRFAEGRPIISTDIVHAHNLTANPVGQPGAVFLCAVPTNYHVGYGAFTTAYVDRQLKRVSGAPLSYAAARRQLALYNTVDTEAARMHVEAEVANGYPLEQHPQYVLEPKYVIGSFVAGNGFDALVSQLDVTIRSLQPVDFDRMERSFKDVLQLTAPTNDLETPSAIRDLITGTIESILLTRLRTMRWQGLALLGYKFYEGKQEVQIQPVQDIVEQRRRMDEMGRLLASSSLFTAELAWLKAYVAHELDIMRIELEGDALESLPD